MSKNKWLLVLLATCVSVSLGALRAGETAAGKADQTLEIDIPAKLGPAHVVFNIDRLALDGDKSIALGHLGLLVNDLRELNAKGQIIAIFHTDAGHLTLNDRAYNTARHVTTGNPYKESLATLMSQGVQIELCGTTAKAHHWVNADLLPGIRVNIDAMVRLTQLGQEGYVQITE
jgi:intracellular sulfur oxidation DsrE/DsrF family protein